jgi:hypothetical protein
MAVGWWLDHYGKQEYIYKVFMDGTPVLTDRRSREVWIRRGNEWVRISEWESQFKRESEPSPSQATH